ncbi:hypothetical protein [Hydrogenophaga sp.]|uniref:hypothetical protein n=1 Tax=Hydrogenophaga sp. TaxID=1904254 RepID=UPI0035624D4E
MNTPHPLEAMAGDPRGRQTTELSVPQLVGRVFESAPAAERSRLLRYLLQPLGVLATAAVANGIFARIRLRSDWSQLNVPLDEVNRVQAADVAALVDRVQQVGLDALDGLVHIVGASPVLASSAAAAVLVAVLAQRMRRTERALDDAE